MLIARHEFGDDAPDGMYVNDGDQALIVINTSKVPQRQRFTLAHELGHHELHRFRGAQQVVDLDVHSTSDGAGGKDLDEVAANSFAAHLLLPATAIKQALPRKRHADVTSKDVVDLVRRYRVSFEMVCYRLKSERVLREADVQRMLAEPRVALYEANGITPEHFAIAGPELPPALAIGAARLWSLWVITDERLAQILELSVNDALKLMNAWEVVRIDRAEEQAERGAQRLAEAGIDLDAVLADLEVDDDEDD